MPIKGLTIHSKSPCFSGALYAMKVKAIYLIFFSAIILLVGSILFIFSPWPGSNAEIHEVTKGKIGSFTIGDSKINIINKNQMLKISTGIKGCKNWLSASTKESELERCILASDIWRLSDLGFNFCPENRDWHADAYFKNNELVKLKLRCTYPI